MCPNSLTGYSLMQALRQQQPIMKTKKCNSLLLTVARNRCSKIDGVSPGNKASTVAAAKMVVIPPKATPTKVVAASNVKLTRKRVFSQTDDSPIYPVVVEEDEENILFDISKKEEVPEISTFDMQDTLMVYNHCKEAKKERRSVLIDANYSEDHPVISFVDKQDFSFSNSPSIVAKSEIPGTVPLKPPATVKLENPDVVAFTHCKKVRVEKKEMLTFKPFTPMKVDSSAKWTR